MKHRMMHITGAFEKCTVCNCPMIFVDNKVCSMIVVFNDDGVTKLMPHRKDCVQITE